MIEFYLGFSFGKIFPARVNRWQDGGAGSQKSQQEVKLGPAWSLCSKSINGFSVCRHLRQELPVNYDTSDIFRFELPEQVARQVDTGSRLHRSYISTIPSIVIMIGLKKDGVEEDLHSPGTCHEEYR